MKSAFRRFPGISVGIYAVDQDSRTTTTLGVFGYTKRLLEELAGMEAPEEGMRITVYLAEPAGRELAPAETPEWMRLRYVRGLFGRGGRRLFADHVLAPWFSRRHEVMFYPKGWLPLFRWPGVKEVCVLQDGITHHYLRHHREFAGWGMRYFDMMTRVSLRRAERVITITRAAAEQLRAGYGGGRNPVIIPSGGFDWREKVARRSSLEEGGVLVMGSMRPHKRIPETLEMLGAYARRKGMRLKVTVTGVGGPPPGLREAVLEGLDLVFAGRVTFDRLAELQKEVCLTVYLSEIEGLGLPLLEAYEVGVPVCYRADSAMAEVMAGAPGGWDGVSEESFCQAFDEAAFMKEEAIDGIREDLARRFSWPEIARGTLRVFREVARPERFWLGRVRCSSMDHVRLAGEVVERLRKPGERVARIGCVNAHIYNLLTKDKVLADDVNACDVVGVDGMAVVWAARLRGNYMWGRCNMTDALNVFLAEQERQKIRFALIGCSEEEAETAAAEMGRRRPGLEAISVRDGYGSDKEIGEWLAGLRDVDLLCVGMGSPRSERVMAMAAEHRAARMIWHIGGGTIRFLAGTEREAPGWMRRCGLQWLHRLWRHPAGMWKRYLIGNPLFVIRMILHRDQQPPP